MQRTFAALTIAWGLALVFPSSGVLAQSPGTGGSAPAAPDVVRLLNGGLLRGTIAESLPRQHVVIVTLAGEARTIPMIEILYAGSAARDPMADPVPVPTQTPEPTPAPRPAHTPALPRWATDHADHEVALFGAGLSFFVRDGGLSVSFGNGASASGTSYRQLCTAPCMAELPAGSYELALAEPGGDPVAAGSVFIRERGRVRGSYTDNTALRVAGWIIAGASMVAMIAYVASMDFSTATSTGPALVVSLGSIGTVVGILMASLISDSANVRAE